MFSPHDALPLPPNPSLDHYKKRAKDLVKAANDSDPQSLALWAKAWIDHIIQLSHLQITPTLPVRASHWISQLEQFARAEKSSNKLSLAKAQFILARAHGFESWPKLSHHIAAIKKKNSSTLAFEQAVEAIVSGDQRALASLLKKNPALPKARSTREHQATLLHYIAANGVEGYRQKTPTNAVAIAELLLSSGADVNATAALYGSHSTTLALAATSIHPEEAGILQPLLELLLARGARLDDPTLVTACVANGHPKAAHFLASVGAPLTLESAAGVGNLEKVKTYFARNGNLKPNATRQQLHAALLWAAEYGHNEIVGFLLDHGAPIDAKSPDGQTALHWAVIGARISTIELLIARGADLTLKNSYGGTPLAQARWSAANGPTHIDYAKVIDKLSQAETIQLRKK